MKSWKLVLGAGAACAACCAVPVVGGLAAFGLGAGTFAAIGAALAACPEAWVPFAAVAVAAGRCCS
ncbi:hypothetical protein [Ramlibacter algicola]|uniref:hypothetical protein n=1 Tax=Ramlibacter algicola TaxID=2795217 RepID=UPI001EF10DAE|nr:hypothetical protein [Ramlibacter algicola]